MGILGGFLGAFGCCGRLRGGFGFNAVNLLFVCSQGAYCLCFFFLFGVGALGCLVCC